MPSSPDRIEILVSDIPICSQCGKRACWLGFEEIPDGVTTILTWFVWWCAGCGHATPAPGIPDLYVETGRPSTEQIDVRQLSTERSPN